MSKKPKTLAQLIPATDKDGNALRWGLAVALQGPVDPLRHLLSELGNNRLHRKRSSQVDWLVQCDAIVRRIDASLTVVPSVSLCVDAVLWAYSIGTLQTHLNESQLLNLIASLRKLALHCATVTDPSDLARLIGGGELTLALSWKLPPLFTDEQKLEAIQPVCLVRSPRGVTWLRRHASITAARRLLWCGSNPRLSGATDGSWTCWPFGDCLTDS